MSNIRGYIRVSTRGQDEDRQLVAMDELHVSKHHILVDKQYGYGNCIHRPCCA